MKTYYFQHDCNARNDEKILAVRMKFGMEGYGVYFAILERLQDTEDHTLTKDYNNIAFDLRCQSGIIKGIVEDFGLFKPTDDGKRFYSPRFSEQMKKTEEIKKSLSEAGKNGAKKRWGNAENTTPTPTPLENNSQPIATIFENNSQPIATPTKNDSNKIRLDKNKKENIKEKTAVANFSFIETFSKDFQEIFKDWFAYKSARKNSYKTEHGARLFCENLIKMSDNDAVLARKIVEQSISNNYMGVFPLKQEGSKQYSTQTADFSNITY